MSSLEKPSDNLPSSERRADLKTKVLNVLGVLQSDCEPAEM